MRQNKQNKRRVGDMPNEYLGSTAVGKLLGVQGPTVTRWMTRHRNFPAPDVIIISGRYRIPGWHPSRKAELRAWDDNRRNDLLRRGYVI